ncbi:EAL and GGDEF domain-containing protein [Peribacillus alkalitolerans]|uniref:sensor domain-containing protein n=1 Tax=Peribacillus alkalitolerans TaxID=1550385 RepID=UPI001F076EF2|nr:bifunctional diguanylate cyclase/phosphodiesterase [Peribacillus alkalitolerans]
MAKTNMNMDHELKDNLANLVFETMDDAVLLVDDIGEIFLTNRSIEKVTGFTMSELTGKTLSFLFISKTEFASFWQKAKILSNGTGEFNTNTKMGSYCMTRIKVQGTKWKESNGYYLVFMKDITEIKKKTVNLQLTNKIFENTSEGVLITDAKGRILTVNPAFQIVTGYSEEEVLGKNPSLLQSGLHNEQFYLEMWREINEKGIWKGEIWNKRKNGEVFPEWISIIKINEDSGKTSHFVAVFSDLSDRKHTEEQLRKLAHYDALTGAANRYLLNKSLERLLITSKKYNQILAVLFLDLDRFKQVNDTLGHSYGDLLLKKVSARLKSLLKNKDIIARLGGDEFVIVLSNIKHAKEAVAVSDDIIKALNSPFLLHDHEVYISTSIGVSLFPYDGDDLETLLKNADRAMYQAKANGKNNFSLYHNDLHQENETRQMKIQNLMRKALVHKEFSLSYHPQVETRTGTIVAVEALLRWNQRELGNISPAEFIPIAEETGQIIPISDWVLTKACEDGKKLHLAGFPNLKIAVNISGLYFNQVDFVQRVSSIIQNTNFVPQCLELELTESIIMPNAPETINKLVKLKALGVKLSVDDFGTGYSSLSYLHRFPIDSLKIDQSFIKNLHVYNDDASIVKAIITMAQRLHLEVVAEGVEGKHQYKFLQQENSDYVQGYYITEPLPYSRLLDFMELWDYEKFNLIRVVEA